MEDYTATLTDEQVTALIDNDIVPTRNLNSNYGERSYDFEASESDSELIDSILDL